MSMRAKLIVGAIVGLGSVTIAPLATPALTQPIVAAQNAAAGQDAAARGLALIKAAAKAHGGDTKLSEIKDASSSAKITLATPQGDMDGTVKGVVLQPDKARGVLTLPFGDLIQTFDGTNGTLVLPGQDPMEIPPAMLPEMRRAVLL